MSSRRRISARERAAIFARCGGRCHICGHRVDGTHERWEVEHIIPLELGGDDEGDNLAPAHVACHRDKTKADARAIAKTKRMQQRAIGIGRQATRKLRGGRHDNIKFKVGGGWEPRE